MRLIAAAGVAILVAACASAPMTPPSSARPSASSSVAATARTGPSEAPGTTPDPSLASTAPSATPNPDATPVWGYVDTGVPTPTDDFVQSDQAYFVIGAGDWVRVWVGAPASAPDHGILLFHRAPLVDGRPDMLRDRETRFNLPLTNGPWMIIGVLDNGVLALQSGDGTARTVGLDLTTLAIVHVGAGPQTIDCGALAAADCRAVLDATLESYGEATIARVVAPVCYGPCPTAPPAGLYVSVLLQETRGGSTTVTTCTRAQVSGPVRCETLPVRRG